MFKDNVFILFDNLYIFDAKNNLYDYNEYVNYQFLMMQIAAKLRGLVN